MIQRGQQKNRGQTTESTVNGLGHAFTSVYRLPFTVHEIMLSALCWVHIEAA